MSGSESGGSDATEYVVITKAEDDPTSVHIVLRDYECSMTVRPSQPGGGEASLEGAYIDGISFDGAGHYRTPIDGMPDADFARLCAIAEEHAAEKAKGNLSEFPEARTEVYAILTRHCTAAVGKIDPIWLEDFASFGPVPP